MEPGSASPTPAENGAPRTFGRRQWLVVAVVAVVAAAAIEVGYFLLAGPGPNHAPVPVIQASTLTPEAYRQVTLNGSGSYDPDGDTFFFAWSLPDGSASTARVVNLTLTSVGTFRVTLTVTDDRGARSNASVNLTSHAAPLRVGTNTPFPPFEFYDLSARLVGFDIDLADNATARLAYAPVWTDVSDFSVLLTSVGSGSLDMAASAITSSGWVGAVRNASMYFSVPYYEVTYGVLVGSSSNLTCLSTGCTPEALANRTVGVQSGTGEEAWVQDQLVTPGYTPPGYVYVYAGVTNIVAALQLGSIEMAILDSWVAASLANGSSFRVAGSIQTGEQYSLAFTKDAAGLALRNRMNTVLVAMVADGTLEALTAKWFSP